MCLLSVEERVRRAGAHDDGRADALVRRRRLFEDEELERVAEGHLDVGHERQVARDLGPGHTVVTILCDGAHRYASKMFDVAYLEGQGLPAPAWLAPSPSDDVDDALCRALADS